MTENGNDSEHSDHSDDECRGRHLCTEIAVPDRSARTYNRADPFVIRLGGQPTWLCGSPDLDIKCPVCSTERLLIAQLDCPDDDCPTVDRVLYVFACNSKHCLAAGPDNVFLAIIQTKAVAVVAGKTSISANFWEEESIGEEQETVKSAEPDYVACSLEIDGGFPVVVLKVIDEYIPVEHKQTWNPIPTPLVADESEPESESESDDLPLMELDEPLEAFQERVSHHPRQCLRYSPSGRPIHFSSLYSKNPLPRCHKCLKEVIFLAQLMPAILSVLPVDDPQYCQHISSEHRGRCAPFGDGLAFGTVLIYICPECSPQCNATSYRATVQVEFE